MKIKFAHRLVGELDAVGKVTVDHLADLSLAIREPPELDTIASLLQVLRQVCTLGRLASPVRPLRLEIEEARAQDLERLCAACHLCEVNARGVPRAVMCQTVLLSHGCCRLSESTAQ